MNRLYQVDLPDRGTFLRRTTSSFRIRGPISEVARRLPEAGAQNRLDDLVKIHDLPEQPTEALLRMRRKREDDQEFIRAQWDVLARYAEKGCEQHGFSSDSALPSRESFANCSKRSSPYARLRSDTNPQLDNFGRVGKQP